MQVRARVFLRRGAPGLFAVLSFLLFWPALASAAGSIKLAWDPPASTEHVAGYVVSYRTLDGALVGSQNAGLANVVWVRNLKPGVQYAFTVSSYNANGVRSAPSNEIVGVPEGPPDTEDTPLEPSKQTYFAEGATGKYDYRLALINTNEAPAAVEVRFLREGGDPVLRQFQIPAQAHYTLSARDVPELNGQGWNFGAALSAAPGVIAERTMSWNSGGFGAGSHTAKAMSSPARTWQLAEGAAGFWDTYILIANPNGAAATVTTSFLRDDGVRFDVRKPVAANGRLSIFTNDYPELQGRTFGATVQADQDILVERAMYFRFSPGDHWEGHASSGSPEASPTWFLAEGNTGAFFDTFLLLANPNAQPTDVTVRYLTDGGGVLEQKRTIGANTRETIRVDDIPELLNQNVSFDIKAALPITVERSMYWPGVDSPWYGAHNSVGVTSLGTEWALAEGQFGGDAGAETFVLLANPGNAAATVTLSYYRENGQPPTTIVRGVGPHARLTVSAGDVAAEAPGGLQPGEKFGVFITSTQPIAVERSIYSSPNGIFWKTGTSETGTKIR